MKKQNILFYIASFIAGSLFSVWLGFFGLVKCEDVTVVEQVIHMPDTPWIILEMSVSNEYYLYLRRRVGGDVEDQSISVSHAEYEERRVGDTLWLP